MKVEVISTCGIEHIKAVESHGKWSVLDALLKQVTKICSHI